MTTDAGICYIWACNGCGVCVHKCPTRSLVLERREEIADPPADMRELGARLSPIASRRSGEGEVFSAGPMAEDIDGR